MTKAEIKMECKRQAATVLLAALMSPDPVKAAGRGSRMMRRLHTFTKRGKSGYKWTGKRNG